MTPKISGRGHSFKGLIAYLMHDREAETSERVAWHQCSDNMRTQDPMKAAKVMAYTDISRDELKRAAGVSTAGRKPKEGAVFHYSLNWEHGNTPTREHMTDCVMQTLQRLGLAKHEYVMVAHNDTDHAHVHIVANVTNPENGTRHDVGLSKRKIQQWALEYEREHGLQCYAREENAQNRDRGIVEKYQDQQRDYKQIVSDAFTHCDNGASFVQALREQGLALANGDRGKWVIVDQQGNIDALTRNLDIDARGKAKTAAIKAKFADLDRNMLLDANDLATARRDALAEQEQRHSPEKIIERMEKHHAAFTRHTIERELYRTIQDDSERRQVIDAVLQHDSLLNIGEKDGRKVYATQQMIDLEQGFIKTAQGMSKQHTHGVDDKHRKAAIATFNAELAEKLNDETAAITAQQRAAIEHITQGNQLSNLVGIAGAGKSTILGVAKETWEAQGYRVRGAALSGIAAQSLKDNGIDAGTLHSLEGRARVAAEIMQQQQGKALTEKQAALVQDATITGTDVLVIDEAGMVSTPQMKRVMEMAQQAGAKVVLVGDHEQLQSIEAGAAFRTVLERTNTAELDEVRRQREDWQKAATVDFAKGEVGKGLHAYDAQGCIHHVENRDDAKDRLIADMMHSYDKNADKARMVLAYTRADVNDLNQQIKQQMIERGVVQRHGHDTTILIDDGDETHQTQERFSIGDRLMFRANSKALGVMNGTLGTIAGIEEKHFTVTLDNGKTVEFDSNEYQKFQLGYAATVHKSQGVTVDEAYVLGSRHFDRHASYVAMSRHTETAQLYTAQDDFKSKDRMFAALSKDGANLSTLDFVNDEQRPVILQPSQEKVKEQENIMRKPHSPIPEQVIIEDQMTGKPNRSHMSSKERWEMEAISKDGDGRATPQEFYAQRAQDDNRLSPEPAQARQEQWYVHPEAEAPFNDVAQKTYADARQDYADALAAYQQSAPQIDYELPRADGGTVKIYDRCAEERLATLKANIETRQLSPENAAREELQQSLQEAAPETPQDPAQQRKAELMQQIASTSQSLSAAQMQQQTETQPVYDQTPEQRYSELMGQLEQAQDTAQEQSAEQTQQQELSY